MKKVINKLVLFFCCSLFTTTLFSQQLAFPGAEGFGRFATGGRTGTVYHVTNLNDSGTGSFRDAVSVSNRIVVFDVAGVINIKSRISVKSNIYIAGQTAPGEGITIYGDGMSFSGANNTICRYLRLRMGKVGTKDQDALGIASGSNMIFDHVSVAWGLDENFSVTGTADNITIQNSIISQGLLAHSAGGLVEPSGSVTIYRSLYIHNDTRNPKFKGKHQYVNNIVYNWKSAAYIMGGDSNSRSYANAVSNYFITGRAGSTTAFSGGNDKYSIYALDNWVDTNRDGILNGVEIPRSDYKGGPTFQETPYSYPTLPTIPATDLYENLVSGVGASLPYRDNLDWNLIKDLASFGEEGDIISDEKELLIGAPSTWNVWKGTARTDSDNDGISDEWESANGLNPNDPSDAMIIGADGYTNLERYINSITAGYSQKFLKAPMSLRAKTTTQNEIVLKWLDYTDWEDGYIIEEKLAGSFVEIARVGKNIDTYTASNLDPESTHIYRVKGFNAETTTDYTNELTVKTRPIPVNVVDPNTFVPDAIWTGANSAEWNYSAVNWNIGAIEAGKKILFDESGANKTITLTENINQNTMLVKGNDDYSFSGTGVIGGDGSVNKTGKGKVTLGANNTYTGATVIWDGVMEISKLANGGQPSSIGTSQPYDFNWVWNGGTMRYTGVTVSTDRNVALENETTFEVTNSAATVTFNGVVAGEGDFIKSGPGSFYSKFSQHTYTGNTIVKDGTYELNGNYAEVDLKGKLILEGGRFKTSGGADGRDGIFSFPIEVRGDKKSYLEPTRNSQIKSKVFGTGDLQIDVSYLREFYTGNWDEYYGELTVNVNSQEFMLSTSIPNARIILKNGGMKAGSNDLTISLGALSGDATANLYCSHVKTAGGAATWVIGGLNTDEEFKGLITSGVTHDSRKGRSNIVKEGTGYWRLTNTGNKYLGYTTINGGMLIVNGVHTTDKDWDSNGVYSSFTPQVYTVNSEGTLAGKGTITTTAVNVKNGGFLAPGDGIGTLTINGPVNLEKGSTLIAEIDRNKKTADRLTVVGKLTLAGDLNIDLVDGEFKSGDAMIILSASSYSGSFENIYPATPGEGLAWDTNSLYTSGILRVGNALGINEYQNSDLKVRSINGMIVIESMQSAELVTVYNLSGRAVFNQEVNSSTVEVPVETGLYLVRIGNKMVKVVAKKL